MIAVLFEVQPREGQRPVYLGAAAMLRPHLQQIPGFVSIERFASLSDSGKLLSLSYWRDEAAVKQWRELDAHRCIQARGRAQMFVDYRLRIAEVVRDYGMFDRAQAPDDSRAVHG